MVSPWLTPGSAWGTSLQRGACPEQGERLPLLAVGVGRHGANGPRLGRESLGDWTGSQSLHRDTPWDINWATTLTASTEVMEVTTCNQSQGELSSQGKTT